MPRNKLNPRVRWLFALTLIAALALTAVPLPTLFAVARPSWVALVIVYWCLFATRYVAVTFVFLAGLLVDVATSTLLGQHALALLVMAYVPLRFHLRMRVFSWLQLTSAVFALLALYQFMLLWINGISGLTTSWIDYALPVITGTLVWPIVILLLDGLRLQELAADR